MSTMPTVAQWKSGVIATVGDEGGVLVANIDFLWLKNSDYAYDPFLQFLYTKRDAYAMVLGAVRDLVDKTVGPLKIAYGQRARTLTDILKAGGAMELEIAERIAQGASSGPVVGRITQDAPTIPPFPYLPDENDSRYLGDPYKSLTIPR